MFLLCTSDIAVKESCEGRQENGFGLGFTTSLLKTDELLRCPDSDCAGGAIWQWTYPPGCSALGAAPVINNL